MFSTFRSESGEKKVRVALVSDMAFGSWRWERWVSCFVSVLCAAVVEILRAGLETYEVLLITWLGAEEAGSSLVAYTVGTYSTLFAVFWRAGGGVIDAVVAGFALVIILVVLLLDLRERCLWIDRDVLTMSASACSTQQ